MRYEYKPSFDRTFKKLTKERQKRATKAISSLIDFFEGAQRRPRLGLKQLRGNFWEIRVGIKDRIIFTFEDDTISFVIILFFPPE
ncbi:MAG: hypothetical protein AB1466_06170 [Actinomycetota bacterium]